jgi:CrcB protein
MSMSSAPSSPTGVPVDPDVDLHVASQRHQRTLDPAVLLAVAVGGVLGAEARYALTLLWPAEPGHWPMATWVENVSGSFLLGALMVVLLELTAPHRLVRPFLGVGVLGGYTTFSTATVEVESLVRSGRPGVALAYLLGTVVAALVAVALGTAALRWAAAAWARRPARRGEAR